MAEVAHRFDDSTAYERFMGNWSRAAGAVFLDWIAAPPGAGWLDVGCGTGSLARLILDRCSPAAVTGIDPSAAQIGGTRHSSLGALGFLFERAGLKEIAARSLEVTMRFPNFDDFWKTQTPSHNPMTRMIAAMTRGQREDLLQAVLAALPVGEDGGIEFSARANAIMGRVPR